MAETMVALMADQRVDLKAQRRADSSVGRSVSRMAALKAVMMVVQSAEYWGGKMVDE